METTIIPLCPRCDREITDHSPVEMRNGEKICLDCYNAIQDALRLNRPFNRPTNK